MITVNAEERDWQLTDELFLVEIAPTAIKVYPGVPENDHDVRRLGIHPCTEMRNTLKVTMSVASHINHIVPPVCDMDIS